MISSIALVPFSGKQEDWTFWSIKFLARSTICGYRGVLIGGIAVPAESEDLSSARKESRQ